MVILEFYEIQLLKREASQQALVYCTPVHRINDSGTSIVSGSQIISPPDYVHWPPAPRKRQKNAVPVLMPRIFR